MLEVAGYMHVYATEAGLRIHQEQKGRAIKSGLWNRSTCVSTPVLYPPDGKLFEGHTLEAMWYDCKDYDGLVWYVHTKGASVGPERQASYRNIRNLLQSVVIDQWEYCIQWFEENPELDCFGAYLPTDNRFFFPHNMWWARSSHIRSLPSPRKWAEELCGRKGENVRYGYEDWVTLSKPGTIAKAYGPWKP